MTKVTIVFFSVTSVTTLPYKPNVVSVGAARTRSGLSVGVPEPVIPWADVEGCRTEPALCRNKVLPARQAASRRLRCNMAKNEKGVEKMPRTCTVCGHQKREDIDQALLAGEAYRTIAKRFGASPGAIFRHGRDHIPAAMLKEAGAQVPAGTLFERLRAINRETQDILHESRKAKNHVVALEAIGRVERQLELEARLFGDLDDSAKNASGLETVSEPIDQRPEAHIVEVEAHPDQRRGSLPTPGGHQRWDA